MRELKVALGCLFMLALLGFGYILLDEREPLRTGPTTGQAEPVTGQVTRHGPEAAAEPETWRAGPLRRKGSFAARMAVSPGVVRAGDEIALMMINAGRVPYEYGREASIERRLPGRCEPTSRDTEEVLESGVLCDRGTPWELMYRRALDPRFRGYRSPAFKILPGESLGPDSPIGRDALVLAGDLQPGLYRVRRSVSPVPRSGASRGTSVTAPFAVKGAREERLSLVEVRSPEAEQRNGPLAGKLSLGAREARPGETVDVEISSTGRRGLNDGGVGHFRRWSGSSWGAAAPGQVRDMLPTDGALVRPGTTIGLEDGVRVPDRLSPGLYLYTRSVQGSAVRPGARHRPASPYTGRNLGLTSQIRVLPPEGGKRSTGDEPRLGTGPIREDGDLAARLLASAEVVRGTRLGVAVQNLGSVPISYGLTAEFSRLVEGSWRPVPESRWSAPIKTDIIQGLGPDRTAGASAYGDVDDRWEVPVTVPTGIYRMTRQVVGLGARQDSPSATLSVAFRLIPMAG